jgi:small GTP-binding protein
MHTRLLDARRQAVLQDERALLGRIARALARIDVPLASQDTFSRSVEQLDELFLLVVVGEFNAGKSAFINALVGGRVLEEGVTPTTARIGVLKYGEQPSREATPRGYDVVTAPLDLLREINIVDTPGTNAVLRAHEALTREFVPRADLVLFVTSSDRPFTESERAFLEVIREWGKKILVAVNKVDLLETPADLAAVVDFVATNARALLGTTPEIFPVSARLALRGRVEGDAARVEASGFPALERFVVATLDEGERFRLKLRNPVGVGRRVVAEARDLVEARLGLLKDDFEAIAALDAQLATYREDMRRDLRFRLADIDKELLDFERRGHAFFDEMLRVGRLLDLLNREKVAAAFERDAVGDLPKNVERRVDEMVDWMADTELRQWRGISEQLGRRQQAHAEHMAGRIEGPFESSRTRLLERVRRESQRAVETYDHAAESRRLAQSVRDAIAGAALLQVGAVGLGAVVTAVATTTVVDVTGLLAAGVLSVVGLLVLPARRGRARKELGERVTKLRETLMPSLSSRTEEELDGGLRRIEEAMAPYTRFVRSEGERLTALREDLVTLKRELGAMSARIDAL